MASGAGTDAQRAGVAIIGAGVIGAAIAHELSSFGVDTLVFEAAAGSATGASGTNAGIIHTGFDSQPGSFETDMILANGNRWRQIFDELAIPYVVTGAVMLALTLSEAAKLAALAENAAGNGIKVRQFDKGQVRNLAPYTRAQGGLLIPDEAITDPYEVVERLLHAAGTIRYGTKVQSVEPHEHGVLLQTSDGAFTTRFAVNCAGLFADDIDGSGSFSITPRRGEFIVFPAEAAPLTDHILLPVPKQETKGVLVFPTVHGNVCAGPTAVDQNDKNDWRVRDEGTAEVRKSALKLVPKLANFEPMDSWAGLRAVGHPHNYIVEWSKRVPALFNVAGIRSTGLSACLGISAYVIDRLRERGLAMGARRSFAKAQPIVPKPWWQRRRA
ncbi:MAG: FAD-dependent oxidoreductase [Candidatus Eremiobacteraeota bacterium]|nr:FAD-dependent oxidoreductase [Candidatus Eremiobacteraeota bacterium]